MSSEITERSFTSTGVLENECVSSVRRILIWSLFPLLLGTRCVKDTGTNSNSLKTSSRLIPDGWVHALIRRIRRYSGCTWISWPYPSLMMMYLYLQRERKLILLWCLSVCCASYSLSRSAVYFIRRIRSQHDVNSSIWSNRISYFMFMKVLVLEIINELQLIDCKCGYARFSKF